MAQLTTEQRLEHAIEALKYYGEPTTWTRSGRGETYKAAPYTEDHGERARAALRVLLAPASQPGLFARVRSALKSPSPERIRITVPTPAATSDTRSGAAPKE